MYSPKIKEEYIPVLYKLAKTRGIPMTHLVKEAIDEFLSKPETKLLQTQTVDNNHNQV
jgi:hypothetical protein